LASVRVDARQITAADVLSASQAFIIFVLMFGRMNGMSRMWRLNYFMIQYEDSKFNVIVTPKFGELASGNCSAPAAPLRSRE
jgi:hypothetical protein